MTEILEPVRLWIIELSERHGVDPIVFGIIYIGATPLFGAAVGWLITAYRNNRSIVLPTISCMLTYSSSYLYLIIEGENIPWWVYGMLVGFMGYGMWVSYRRIKKQIIQSQVDNE
ncbi:MAG: hypothetical protein ACQETE_09240 [Bacteroidota bacterium]|jgi:CHASE2 domain-containing sensor protein